MGTADGGREASSFIGSIFTGKIVWLELNCVEFIFDACWFSREIPVGDWTSIRFSGDVGSERAGGKEALSSRRLLLGDMGGLPIVVLMASSLFCGVTG